MMMLHKINRRLLNGGLLAAIVVAGLTGCGGDGGSAPRRDTVPLTGGSDTIAVTLDNAAPADANGQTISINGGSDTAFLAPTDEAIPAGTTLVIVPEGTRFFGGLSRTASRAPGDVFVNGVDSGVNVDQNGQLDGNIAVVNNESYEIFAQGPFTIERDGKRLDIQEGFEFNVVVRSNTVSLPELIDGTIPSNGGGAADMFLSVTYPAPFDNDNVLLIVEKSNGDVQQSRDLSPGTEPGSGGTTTFRDLVPDVVVPNEGIDRVVLRFTER